MNRALVNFIVDTAIAVAFVVSAVSGLVFLLPAEWLTLSTTSSTSALGVEYATWRTLHDWTAVIMIAGVVLHTALHWRWVTTMVRRLTGGGQAAARPAAASAAGRAGLTRHAFLKRAGVVGGAALVGGLVGRSVASAAASWLGESGSGAQSAGESAQTTTSTARVAIDAGRCTGCGACLKVCPFGVFAAGGSTVVVADADTCRLCGHCAQVCRPGAIMLNG